MSARPVRRQRRKPCARVPSKDPRRGDSTKRRARRRARGRSVGIEHVHLPDLDANGSTPNRSRRPSITVYLPPASFSRSSASTILARRAIASSRFSRSPSTTSSGARSTKSALPSLASTRLMSASALAISLLQPRALGGEVDHALERQRRDLAAHDELHRALRRRVGERDVGDARQPLDELGPALGARARLRRRADQHERHRASPAGRSSRRAPSGSR